MALSSDDKDAPVATPESFLKCNTETECTSNNSSSFQLNSDDELAKYLESEIIAPANIKKEKTEVPDYSPAKMIRKEKKERAMAKENEMGMRGKTGPKKENHQVKAPITWNNV